MEMLEKAVLVTLDASIGLAEGGNGAARVFRVKKSDRHLFDWTRRGTLGIG